MNDLELSNRFLLLTLVLAVAIPIAFIIYSFNHKHEAKRTDRPAATAKKQW